MNKWRISWCLFIFALLVVSISSFATFAQDQSVPPAVTSLDVPIYPPLARTANIEGMVHVRVTTDGKAVIDAHAEDGNKLLAEAAQSNARTWRFVSHEPTSFTVMFRFKLVTDLPEQNYPRVVLQLPENVEVDILRWPGTKDFSPDKRK